MTGPIAKVGGWWITNIINRFLRNLSQKKPGACSSRRRCKIFQFNQHQQR
ncbi:hypothetical protein CCP3SC1AL1_1420011 [Gammaproteobacteria bacterium]